MDIWFAKLLYYCLSELFHFAYKYLRKVPEMRENPLGWRTDWNVTKFWDKQSDQRPLLTGILAIAEGRLDLQEERYIQLIKRNSGEPSLALRSGGLLRILVCC